MKYKIINGAITLGDNTILEEVNIDINDGERIGIVGKNGAGKTTLLKALIDNTLFSEGIGEEKFQIIKFGNFSIGYQEQIKFVNESTTLYEELLSSFKDLVDMEKLLNKYLDNMNVNPSTENILKYTELENQFKILGGYEYKCECEVILDKFKFTKEDKTKRIQEFSGGEKTKIAFMKLLLQKPDLLILDEPTNHLDLDTILWLEKYLENYKKTLIVVSHDRAFLNNIVNVIYDIEYGKTTKYVGNYEKYEKLKKERYDKLLYDYEMQQKEIKRLTAIYERFRFKPAKAKMALAKLHQIERMDLLDKPRKEDLKVFKVNLDKIEKTGRIAFKTKNLCVGYNIPLARINVEVASESRLGIIGKNGTGKSTFLKTIYDLIPALSGKYQFGVNANIGYFDQSLANISGEKTVLEEFQDTYKNLTQEEVRSILGSFLFKGDDVFKKISVLSGGEKVRLILCKILYNKPNILILDEPTNHMDIISKEHFEEILGNYKGTIIFVSHDRFFLQKIATELLIFDNFDVTYFPYNYKEYESIENKKNDEAVKVKKVLKEKKSVEKTDIGKNLRKLENSIVKEEEKLKELKETLFKEEVYSDYIKSKQVKEEIEVTERKLDELNNEWFRLAELNE